MIVILKGPATLLINAFTLSFASGSTAKALVIASRKRHCVICKWLPIAFMAATERTPDNSRYVTVMT